LVLHSFPTRRSSDLGVVLFFAFNTFRKHIPDEEQKLEFKVRLKYKLNDRYRQLVAKSPEGRSNAVAALLEKELGPLMDKMNQVRSEEHTSELQSLAY